MKIFAHNINTGGALVLLREMISRLEARNIPATIYVNDVLYAEFMCERRAKSAIKFERGGVSDLLRPRVSTGERVLYFGNLPPLLPQRNAAVYVHNPYLSLSLGELISGVKKGEVSSRYILIGIYFRLFNRNCERVLVQTRTMQQRLQALSAVVVGMMPFYSPMHAAASGVTSKTTLLCAIGLPSRHKVYLPLLAAIEQLLKEGIAISVEMTVPVVAGNEQILQRVDAINRGAGRVLVVNHGIVGIDDIKCIYARSRALVFPSLKESFGLPLIEAAENGLKIFAPLLPYVDDVVAGYEVIDPLDEISICNALRGWIARGCPDEPARSIVRDRGDDLLAGRWA